MSNSAKVYETLVLPARRKALLETRVLKYLHENTTTADRQDAEVITSRQSNNHYVGGKTISSCLTRLEDSGLVDTVDGVNTRGLPAKLYTTTIMGDWVVTAEKGQEALVHMLDAVTKEEAKRKVEMAPIKAKYKDLIRRATAAVAAAYYKDDPIDW